MINVQVIYYNTMKILVPGKLLIAVVFCLAMLNIQCQSDKKKNTDQQKTPETEMGVITKKDYGTTPEGERVDLFTLRNQNGMQVEIITYGGRIISLTAPDKEGKYENVVLGFDSIQDYTADNPFFGALIGRYANRIADGEFYLDGEKFTLPKNDRENTLHGGDNGFDKVLWQAEEDDDGNSLRLTYISEDMEQGFPGKLETVVTYSLKDDNSLKVDYEATTDKRTVVNLTQHSYFNLSGDFDSTILDHEIVINADEFLPVDGSQIPTGEFRHVENTLFDFRKPKKPGEDIHMDNENVQLLRGFGYDHCWVLNQKGDGMKFAASAHHSESGRFLEVFTEEPGIQFYSGNHLDGTLPQKGSSVTYGKRTGFCFETQRFPDSPNQENFPPTTLEPGEKYTSSTSFKFSVKE